MTTNETTLNDRAIETVAKLAQPVVSKHEIYRNTVLVIGDKHIKYDNPAVPEPKALNVATLQGVADFVNSQVTPDGQNPRSLIVHVESPSCVKVLAAFQGDMVQNLVYLTAQPVLPKLITECYLSIEDFQIMLQSRFVVTDVRDAVLFVAGNLRSGLESDIKDDGVAQSVTTKAGLTRREDVPIKNPVLLAPFRTFSEVDQPASLFVFRMQQVKQGEAPTAQVALFEADGSGWRREAIASIGAWLRENLPEGVTILA